MLSAKYCSLLAGVLQQTLLVLMIRYSKTNTNAENAGPMYLNSVAVASAEVFKLMLSFTLEFINSREKIESENTRKGGRISHLCNIFKPMLIFSDKESAKLIVPALLYLIQNNLLFVALANLSVPMYQVTNQGKLLTTALLSRIMLQKKLTGMQYLSIGLLGFGVAFIHLSEYFAKSESDSTVSADTGQNQILGLIAVLICCFTSGLSGVYFEYVLKKSTMQLSVHCRNFHLASWSLLLAIIHIVSNDFAHVKEFGLFSGFDVVVVLVVISQAITGFVVSMMIKYADTVLKGFAISIAAVFATFLSVPLFGTSITSSFVVGASMVAAATKMYSHYGVKTEEVKKDTSARNDTFKQEEEEERGLMSKDGEGPKGSLV